MSTRITSRGRILGATRAIASAGLLALAVTACSGAATTGAPSDDAAGSLPPADQSIGPVSTVAPGDGEGVPSGVIEAAVADAGSRASVDPAEVTVVSAESVTFPDGGLGCPEPGMMYTQVLTPGYRVVVEAGGATYDYRAGTKGGDVRWCENPPES